MRILHPLLDSSTGSPCLLNMCWLLNDSQKAADFWLPWPPICFYSNHAGRSRHPLGCCNTLQVSGWHCRQLLLNGMPSLQGWHFSCQVAQERNIAASSCVSKDQWSAKKINFCLSGLIPPWQLWLQVNYLILLVWLLGYWFRSVWQLYRFITWV